MADLGTITIPVDSSAMVRAVKDAKSLERGIKTLVDAFDSGVIGSGQLSKGLLQLKRQYEGLFGSSQKATAEVRKHAKSLQESKIAAAAAAAAQDRLALAKKKAETAFALGLQRAKEEERQMAQTQAEILRLEALYNQVATAARVYQQAQDSLNRAVALGVLTDDQKQAKLAELSRAYAKVGNDANKARLFVNRFGENAQASGLGINQFGMYAQQVGYQVGDFFVQIQSGTNALVAFGQQATQLAGLIPGVWGAAIGIGISLATAIGAAFMRSGEQAEEATYGINSYEKAMEALTAEIQENQEAFLKLKFDTTSSGVARARQEIEDLRVEIPRVKAEIEAFYAALYQNVGTGGQGSALFFAGTLIKDAIMGDAGEILEGQLADLERALSTLEAQEEAQRMINGGLSVAAGLQKSIVDDKERELRITRELKSFAENLAEGIEEPQKKLDIQREYQSLLQAGVKPVEAMAQAQYNVETALNRSKIASGKLTSEQVAGLEAANAVLLTTFILEEQYRQVATEVELLEKGLSQAAIDGGKLAGLDLSNLTDAAYDVLMLATNMGISVQAAANLALELGRLDRLNQNAGRGATSSRPIEFGTGPNAGKTVEEVRRLNKKTDGGGKGDPLEELRQQIKLETELLGVSEAQARVIQALGKDRSKYSQAEIDAITAEIEAYNQKQEAIERTKQIMDTVKSSMEDAFMSMVDGTKSAKDAFKSMAAEIIKELYRVLVVQQLVNSISGAIGGAVNMLTLPAGPSTGTLGLPKFATGGSMMPGGSYIVGENGPELVIPRHSGTVVNANQTANAMGGGGGFTQNLSINVSGSDSAMVRTEIAKMIPQITNATKAAVIDAKQRGGQMSAAFR